MARELIGTRPGGTALGVSAGRVGCSSIDREGDRGGAETAPRWLIGLLSLAVG